MAENTPEEAPPTDEVTPETPAPEPDSLEALREALAKANKDAERHRKRNKELEPLAAKAQELEESRKTEAEKLNERLSAAERRVVDAMRFEVALDKGLTKSQAKRLVGTTLEELEADAEELLADLGQTARPGEAVPRKPAERLRGGSNPEEPVLEMDPDKLAALVPRNSF